ncbi:hypothetical protein J3R83DRAFT_11708, partial [Lanmaoa asiatica]
VDGQRKPDVVLASKTSSGRVSFPSILSYCEVKRTQDPDNKRNVSEQQKKSYRQLMDMAGLVVPVQRGRRFFLGLALCNSQLTVALLVRGCSIFTIPFDIDSNALTFINVILTITDASPAWVGFDARHRGNEVKVDGISFTILRTIFTSLGMTGKGTVVHLCESRLGIPYGPPRHCVLKDSWSLADWTDDVTVHRLMKSRTPVEISDEEEQDTFGRDRYGVFADCVPVPADADWTTPNLPGIPVMFFLEEPSCDLPNGSDETHSGCIRQDTTENILSRFSADQVVNFEPRKRITTVSLTVGVPIALFSCRRELYNGVMGAICVGHYHGLRLKLLHCDVSENNLMLRVAKLEEKDAVPDWPDHGYIKRAGVLGDWGSALDNCPDLDPACSKKGFVTGTFPFIATELLSYDGSRGLIAHQSHHDLESFFWILWMICINYNGPYKKKRV